MGALFYKQLGLRRGESVVAVPDVQVGPFHNIQSGTAITITRNQ